ncbi:DUF829-domain-containing protein [Trichodelitschia bisporula]|uniref:DUF829-domain-containing protein n=1 Tax=Trichodelitschia bisporula TaxID=703511 RepID=A0A6G1HIM2_9PEZI|nr:DUF829-domain-containing protein [Trichodelitschia bisporula]
MPVPGFQKVAPSVYYCDKPPLRPGIPTKAPTLILLLTWMGASSRYIAKYTSAYDMIFPNTPILLVTCPARDIFLRTESNQRHRLEAAVTILQAFRNDSRILVHAFSNGGARNFCIIAKALRMHTHAPFSAITMVLDSSPGKARLASTRDAIVQVMPKGAVFGPLSLILAYMLIFCAWMAHLFGMKDMIESIRSSLNDTTLVSLDMTRLYIYSDGDTLVEVSDVEEHAVAARAAGWDVEQMCFVGTKHVSHMRGNRRVYLEAIQFFWAKCMLQQRTKERNIIEGDE